ncbi:MAG TPA: entericidin A/B family lipoprotein [Caulobacteraceae bacterium]|nr:entericidin A/B family lipoprotein [Caulobacteraceae bacterium]
MPKLILLPLLAAALALALGACNTIAGIGRDMEAAGEAVTGASDEARR